MKNDKNNIICCCNVAFLGCEKDCPKGINLEPSDIFQIMSWPRRKLSYIENKDYKEVK